MPVVVELAHRQVMRSRHARGVYIDPHGSERPGDEIAIREHDHAGGVEKHRLASGSHSAAAQAQPSGARRLALLHVAPELALELGPVNRAAG